MDDLNLIHYNVLCILKEFEEARNSDKTLLRLYYQRFFGVDVPFHLLDSPASITRSRRKIQRLNPALRGKLEVQLARESHRKVYADFYKNDGGDADL